MNTKTNIAALAVAIALTAAVAQPAAARLDDREPLRINAWAVNMSNVGTPGSKGMVEFRIERWSSGEDREGLISTMLGKGQDALLEQIQKMPSVGRMRFPTWQGPDPLNAQLGWDLRYAARESLPDGGQRIVLLTDRPVGIFEAINRPRTIDYPFTLIELHVDRDGKGVGKMSVATKINFDEKKNVIELEDYASEPVRLQNARIEAPR